ncbi:AraC family transcriptional regulator [Paenibacillus aurantius]|uniref:AraC family transcriptional regulator n=1 Tax=Paenibacillus aurantius TaxID=2918900 RepID=A0AA96LKN1_9BACL|nr:AraC family transcriptional regulator [Paenibacillus aurantius]WNQ13142.1 AraC family transcriptional regulator [Paenibacillus aurantius]
MPAPHSHATFELFYVLDGGRCFFVNDTIHALQKGDLMLISPHDLHRTSSSDAPKCERILINFSESFIRPEIARASVDLIPKNKSPFYRFPINEQTAIAEILHQMLQECETRGAGFETYVRSLLIKLLLQMYRYEHKENQVNLTKAHPMHQKISEIASYLGEHGQHNLSLKEVAHTFYISPAYLSRIFLKITGFKFKEYVLLVRVRRAQRLLRETKLPIGLIAEKAGFEHTSHFNVVFKKLTGDTPGDYRKTYTTHPIE